MLADLEAQWTLEQMLVQIETHDFALALVGTLDGLVVALFDVTLKRRRRNGGG